MEVFYLKVIDGHVIPNAVYFSKAFPSSWQQTLALTDMLRVYLEWKNESVEYGRYQCKSHDFVYD